MLQTPERAADAITTQLPPSSAPTPISDDDTISDSSFDVDSDHFAFTPKVSGKVPRAWERKPATPFAPRTETQRIWKRVPLQEKPANGPVETHAIGKDDDDNARGVKRVRLAASIAGNGKENYANTQWDKNSNDAKRKVPKELKSAIQSARNSVSPLRRDSTFEILNDPPPPTALELEADRVVRRLEEMQKAQEVTDNFSSDGSSPDTKPLKAELLQCAPQTPISEKTTAERTSDHEETISEDGAATTPSTNGFFTDSLIFDDQDSESETDEDPIAEDVSLSGQNIDSGSENSQEQPHSIFPAPDGSMTPLCLDDKAQSLLQVKAEIPLETCEHDTPLVASCTEAEVFEAETESMSPEHSIYLSIPESPEEVRPTSHASETVQDHVDVGETVQEHLESHVAVDPAWLKEEALGSKVVVSESNNEQAETSRTPETSSVHTRATLHAVTYLQGGPDQALDNLIVTEIAQPDILIFGGASDRLSNQLFTPQAPILLAPDAPPSDDTAYLHDFLTRARAKKAARAASSPEQMEYVANSPAKNTRQANNLSTSAGSPSAAVPADLKPEGIVADTSNEDQATSPCRRSSRPRVPKPLKSVVPAISNSIPVRRSNGTEFVFLRRTEAMQVALDTRTNTQRNKGEAVPPNARLGSLVTGEISPIKEKKKSSKVKKTVKWDEKFSQEQLEAVLVEQTVVMKTQSESGHLLPSIQQEATMDAEKMEKREMNARKSVKSLGTVNGTPAPKKRATATALPVPTRNLRARTKG